MKPVNALLIYNKGFVENTKAIRDWMDENIQAGKGREFVLDLEVSFCQKLLLIRPTIQNGNGKEQKTKFTEGPFSVKNMSSYLNTSPPKLRCSPYTTKAGMLQKLCSGFWP